MTTPVANVGGATTLELAPCWPRSAPTPVAVVTRTSTEVLGHPTGVFTTTIIEASSAAQSAGQQALVASPSYAACEREFVARDAVRRWGVPTAAEVSKWRGAPAALTLLLPGGARYYALPIESRPYELNYIISDQFAGPYEAVSVASWCLCSNTDLATLDHELAGVARALVNFPGAGGPAGLRPPPTLPRVSTITAGSSRPGDQSWVSVDWNGYSKAYLWAVQGKTTGSAFGDGPPPTEVRTSSAVAFRPIACLTDCDVTHLPDSTNGPGIIGAFVVGPWTQASG